MKLNAALIGCGRIGYKKHIEAYAANRAETKLVAVCDLVKERAEKASEYYERETGEKPIVLTHYDELFELPIDWVSIATESGYHYPVAMDCLSQRKHVLVEKPMALSTADMEKMISEARERNVKLGVCFQNRFNPAVQELARKVHEKAFGKIFTVTARVLWNRNSSYYQQAAWRGTWQFDGGTLMNQCAHNIDLLQWVMGDDVTRVYAAIRNYNHPALEVEDYGAAIINFKNGGIGVLEGTSNIYPENLEETLSVFGETGTVVLGGLAVNTIQTWRFNGEKAHPFSSLPNPESVYGSGHIPLFKDFCGAIRENRTPFVSGEEGKKAVEIILGIYRSCKERKPIDFPVGTFASTDMQGTLLD
jgi:predicted dehydrogenase